MKKGIKILIVLAIVVVLVLLAVRAVKHKKAEEAAIPPAKEYAKVVKTIVPKWGEVTVTLPYIALVRNDNDTVVSTKVAARVTMIDRPGAQVKKGEVIAKLDDRDLRAKMAAIKSQIAAAKVQLAAGKTALSTLEAVHARTKKLLAVRGASQEQFENEAAKIAEAKAQIAELNGKIKSLSANLMEVAQLLDYTTITAPVSGTIGKAFVNAGDMAMPGKPLLTIDAKAGDYLLVRAPDNIHPTHILYKGKTVRLYPLHHTFNGMVEYRTPILNDDLLTDARVKTDVVVYHGEGVLLPVDAVLDRDGVKTVVEVENGHAHPTTVHELGAGEQGVVVSDKGIVGHPVVVAKPDVLLDLLTGVAVKVEK